MVDSNVEVQQSNFTILYGLFAHGAYANRLYGLLAGCKIEGVQVTFSLPLYLALVLCVIVVPIYAACPSEVALVPEDQRDIEEVSRDSPYSGVNLTAIKETNNLRTELREVALFEILSEAQDVTRSQLIEYAKLAPALVVPVIAEIEEFEEQCKTVDELIWHWVGIDLPLAMNLIKELHAATINDRLLRRSLRVLALAHPDDALQLSHEYRGRFGYVLESIVLESAVARDPQHAITLIPELRNTYYPYPSYTDELSIYKPLFRLGPAYAVEFGLSLDTSALEGYFSEREAYFWGLIDSFCDADPQLFISVKDRIPVTEPRSFVSRCILTRARETQYVTSEEFESLYEELITEDREEIDEFPKSMYVGTLEN